MTQRAWTDLARTLAKLRRQLVLHSDRARGHAIRRAHLERILGVDLAARAICRSLRAKSSRFNGRQFMRLTRS